MFWLYNILLPRRLFWRKCFIDCSFFLGKCSFCFDTFLLLSKLSSNDFEVCHGFRTEKSLSIAQDTSAVPYDIKTFLVIWQSRILVEENVAFIYYCIPNFLGNVQDSRNEMLIQWCKIWINWPDNINEHECSWKVKINERTDIFFFFNLSL